jgi:hypothetical protein
MPVIPMVDQAVQLGLKNTPQAPPDVVASITTAAQTVMALMALQPMVPTPIPVIPFGQAVSMVLTKIEAMMFQTYEQISKIIKSLLDQFNQQLQQALATRKTAEAKLYADLVAAQNKIKAEIPTLQTAIATEQADIVNLQNQQALQQAKYEQTMFTYGNNAYQAKLAGDMAQVNYWAAQAAALDPWLAQIIQMSITIINEKLDVADKKATLAQDEQLAAIVITPDWNTDVNLATDFSVPVPFHPDIPMLPSLPTIPPIPQEPALAKATRKALAKWMATPAIPPIGIAIAAILQMVMGLASNSAATAAQLESQADSMLLLLSGCI